MRPRVFQRKEEGRALVLYGRVNPAGVPPRPLVHVFSDISYTFTRKDCDSLVLRQQVRLGSVKSFSAFCSRFSILGLGS